jgi:hypothetical protein
MTQETLMTDAENTTEGQVIEPATEPATVAEDVGQQQPSVDTPAVVEEEVKPEVAPESYDFKAAEGAVFDPKVIADFSEVAKSLNLSQEKAQSVLDKMAPTIKAQQLEAVETMKAQWAESAKADKEFGGDKLSENLGYAKKALDAFATPELRSLLDESGLGNHPELIRAFVKAGKAISEDGFVQGGRSPSGSKSSAKDLYSNTLMNP